MEKIAYALVFISGIVLYFLTPPDAYFAGLVSGVCWGLGGSKLIST